MIVYFFIILKMLFLILTLLSPSSSAQFNFTDNNSNITVNVTMDGEVNKTFELPCLPVPESLQSRYNQSDIRLVIWKSVNCLKPILHTASPNDTPPEIGPSDSCAWKAGLNFTLTTDGLRMEHAGEYECKAYVGTTGTNMRLIYNYVVNLVVRGPPNAPDQVQARALSESSIDVSWTPGIDNNSPLRVHEIQLHQSQSGLGPVRRMNATYPSSQAKLGGLEPYTFYKVLVRAHNDVGWSTWTDGPETRTFPGKPSIPPQIIKMEANATSAAVSVDYHDESALKGPLIEYVVKIFKDINGDDEEVTNGSYKVNENKSMRIEQSGLTPVTKYRLQVFAYNGRFMSHYAQYHFTTKDGIPGKIEYFYSSEVKSTSFVFNWHEVAVKNGTIIGYKVVSYFGRDPPQLMKEILIDNEKTLKCTFDQLTPSTKYIVKVAARTKAGHGEFTKDYAVLTDRAPPQAPKIVNLTLNGTEGILVNWTLPDIPDSDKEYVIFKICFNSDDTHINSQCLQLHDDFNRKQAYCHCDFSAPYQWAVIPWYNVANLKTHNIFVGVRGSIQRLYDCKQNNPIMCYLDGHLSVMKQIDIPESYQKYLKAGIPNPLLNQSTITWIVICCVIILVIAVAVFLLIWRTTLWYRGYMMADQQMPPESGLLVASSGSNGCFMSSTVVRRGPQTNTASLPRSCTMNGGLGGVPGMLTFAQSRHQPVPIERLTDHVASYHADDDAGYQAEFEAIERCVRVDWPASVARQPENMAKNRYSNVFAYDHSRVILQGKKSDYINANYVDGYTRTRAYIAAQGPMPSTFDDFWLMIWEQGTNVIVMISNFVERGRRKCDQYWPNDGSQTYGNITVSMIRQTQLAFFTIRVFAIRNPKGMKKFKERIVYHYQYTDWQDFDVPRSPLPVLVFVRYTVRHWHENAGPIVVHCSAGVGRTGTYICIESLIQQMEAEHQVNVRGFLEHIRQQRMNLVQTEQQYAFIHDALREYLLCPEHDVMKDNLSGYLRCLKDEEPCGCTTMQKQFQLIIEREPANYEYTEAKRPCNINKNRSRILPIESRKVNLPGEPGVEGSNYINASHLQGYWSRFEFVVSQHPLATTEVDFWKMVWNENSSVIVLLSSDNHSTFWPCQGLETKEIGWLRISYCGREEVHSLATRFEFLLSSSREDYALVCYLWRIKQWPTSGRGEDSLELVKLASRLPQLKSSTGPIIVVDDCGGNRAGIFCSLSVLVQQLLSEGVVDVYFIFKMFHLQRPHMFSSFTDLEFVYDSMDQFIHDMATASDPPGSAPLWTGPLVNEWVPERSISPGPGTLENGATILTMDAASLQVIVNGSNPPAQGLIAGQNGGLGSPPLHALPQTQIISPSTPSPPALSAPHLEAQQHILQYQHSNSSHRLSSSLQHNPASSPPSPTENGKLLT